MPGGWERLASHEGGTVVALATATLNGGALFAATAAGLFRSADGGRRWTAASATPLPLLAAVAPSARFAENGLLFAGTQTGFFRSSDGGRIWRQTLAGGRVFALAVIPGTDGTECVFAGTDQDGILRSEDGGRTWTGANPGLLDLTVLALAFSPDATRDQTGFAATASGLYRTRNGGKAWRAVELPLDDPAVQCLALSPAFARDRLILAGTEHDGLWRSDDGGTEWLPVVGLPAGRIDALAFSPRDPEARLVAAATADGVALSRDGGATWRITGAALPPVLALAFAPDGEGEALVAGLYRDGIARLAIATEDASWVPANTGLGATFLSAIVASPSFQSDRTLFVAGPDAGLRVSRDGGQTWADAGLANRSVYGVTTMTANGGHFLFAATDAGIVRSRDDGMTWEDPAPGSESPASMVAAGEADNDPALIIAATLDGRLIASGDAGDSWHSFDAPFDPATVVSLAVGLGRTVYAGTARPAASGAPAGATLWRSTDGGGMWARWLDERGGAGTLPLAVPPLADDAPVVGIGDRVMRPRRNAWQRRDGARSPLWSSVALAADDGSPVTITALAVSPHYRTDGTLFAATSAGVYRSRDRGRTFGHWSDGFGSVPVLALAPAATDDATILFALTVDGTIWRRIARE